MTRKLTALILAALAVTPILRLADAHEDDPKLLDRVPPVYADAFRHAQPAGPPPQFPSNNVTLMSWLPLNVFNTGATSGNSCSGYVSPSGREYAIMGLRNATGFVDITNPGNAQIVATVAAPNSLWHDMKTYQHYCYVVSEGGNGIQVIDLSQIDSGIATLVREVTTGGSTATHTIALNADSGFLYRCGGNGNGIRIYDLNPDPSNPLYVTTWSDRYCHEAVIYSYDSGPYAGKEIAFCCTGFNGGWDETGLEILDVTDKQNIVQLSRVFWPNAGYSHQCWLTPDRKILYLNDELDEQNNGMPTTTIVFNVENLSAPILLAPFTNGNPATGHNLYTRDNRLYEANYRSGMRVFDTTNQTAPVEIGYFDTWPPDDGNGFNGLWNIYCYFPSGTVIGSDIERGLFVWHIGPPSLTFNFPNGLPTTLNPAGQNVLVEIDEATPGILDAASAKLKLDAGAGVVTVDLVPIGGNQFHAIFPPIACPTPVQFYFEASTNNGTTWRSPESAPAEAYNAIAAYSALLVFEDDMQTNTGWSVGAVDDNATAGLWNRMDPEPTNSNGVVQPNDDHTAAPGTFAWVTDGFAGLNAGDRDVDGGRTTLVTPLFDLSQTPGATISYWRWYTNDKGQNPSQDTFEVQISNNNGINWTPVETVGPGGPEASGGWFYHEFVAAELIPLTTQMRVRFRASDFGGSSLVEALIDDFKIQQIECTPECSADIDGDGTVCQDDLGSLLSVYGLCEGDPGYNPAANVDQTPGQGGEQCINQADLGLLLSQFGSCGNPCQ